jgi:integrase
VAEGPPKTNRGRRTIDLDDGTVDALVSWAALEVEERVAWGDEYQDGGWVFTWEDGRPLEPTGISSRFARRSKAAGVPKLRLHDLRDTHATLLLKEGVAPHVVSLRLGHSSVAFTLQVYAHVLPGQQSEAARVAALVDGGE